MAAGLHLDLLGELKHSPDPYPQYMGLLLRGVRRRGEGRGPQPDFLATPLVPVFAKRCWPFVSLLLHQFWRYCVCRSLRPWDSMNDVVQYEHNMVIQTKTRHQTPIVHTTSLLHIDDLSRGHRRKRSRCVASSSVHRVHRKDGSSSSEMFSAHDLDFSGADCCFVSCSLLISVQLVVDNVVDVIC